MPRCRFAVHPRVESSRTPDMASAANRGAFPKLRAIYSQRKMKEAPITGAFASCLKDNDYQNL